MRSLARAILFGTERSMGLVNSNNGVARNASIVEPRHYLLILGRSGLAGGSDDRMVLSGRDGREQSECHG